MKVVSIDIESTGLKPTSDRIIQIAIIGKNHNFGRTLNPGIPIPKESTAIHGITDAHVERSKRFSEVYQEIADILDGAVIVGFNCWMLDIPILNAEFERVGYDWKIGPVIDVGTIFKKREPRTLTAAVTRYLGEQRASEFYEEAHDAKADAVATLDVYEAMLSEYPDFGKMTIDEQAAHSEYAKRYDLSGFIVDKDGHPVYNLGKAKGTRVTDDPGFGNWMLKQDFPNQTKRVLKRILNGESEPEQPRRAIQQQQPEDEGVPF